MSSYMEHSQRWQQHRQPSTPPYHWGRPNSDGIRPHHYGTADPDKCPFCNQPEKPECECFVTPESEWLSAASCGYGSGYEPGSQMEWNPDCPAHPPLGGGPDAA